MQNKHNNNNKKDKASICDLFLDLRCNVDVNVAVWFVLCCESCNPIAVNVVFTLWIP